MTKNRKAVELFENGMNCTESVITVFKNDLGISSDFVNRIASGFAGGMHSGETCGAVTGAMIVLGLMGENNQEIFGEFIKEFKRRNLTVICSELLKGNPSMQDEYEILNEEGVLREVCPKLVGDAVEIIENIQKG